MRLRGRDLQELRKRLKLTQDELAEQVGVSRISISKWERDIARPEGTNVLRLAQALGVTVAHILGEDTSQESPAHEHSVNPRSIVRLESSNTIEVPIIEDLLSACAGNGVCCCDVTAYAVGTIPFPKEWVGPISPDCDKRPYLIAIEGDSMEDAGIQDGAHALVNPIAEVFNGDVVVVKYDDNWAIKWLYWDRNGGAEVRSATTKYPVRHFTKEDFDDNRIVILGKVMRATNLPRRGK